MANGAHALTLLAPEPASDPEPGAEATLGEAVALATISLCAAVLSFAQTGALDHETKATGADRLTRVSMLQLSHAGGDVDFAIKARAAGKKILRQRLNGSSISPEATDMALDFYLDNMLEAAGRAVAVERTIRAAMAH